MGARLGHDFSLVRIHDDAAAGRSAREVRADAYTVGHHVVFAPGRFAPRTRAGERLLAHELVHVVQQSGHGPAGGASASTWWGAATGVSGLVQRHTGDSQRCLGDPEWSRVDARPKEVWVAANDALEQSYASAHSGNAVLTGSQFEYGGKPGSSAIQLPKGAPNKRSADRLLNQFMGRSRQLAPDVMDCSLRTFYEIKTLRYAGQGGEQLLSYYKLANEITSQEGDPPWKIEYATWYPPHVLKLGRDRRVCTEATDYSRSQRPGLIVYQVQERKGRRKERKEKEPVRTTEEEQRQRAKEKLRGRKLKKVREFVDALAREIDMSERDHRTQKNLIEDPSFVGFWGYWTNELYNSQPPLLSIWDQAQLAVARARTQLKAKNPEKALVHLMAGRRAYLVALKKYTSWKEGLPGAAAKMETTIKVGAVLALVAFVAPTVVGEAAGGLTTTATEMTAAEQMLIRVAATVAEADEAMLAAEAAVTELEIVTAAELEAEMVVLEMLTF